MSYEDLNHELTMHHLESCKLMEQWGVIVQIWGLPREISIENYPGGKWW